MPDAAPRYQLSESGTLTEVVTGVEAGQLVPVMRRGESAPATADREAARASVREAVEETRRFLARCRAERPTAPDDPDALQARIMRRGGSPSVEHYTRVFLVEGMPRAQAEAEARRMVEADRELLARYPAA